MHELIERLWSKLRRERHARLSRGVPLQRQTTYVYPKAKWYEPVIASPEVFADDCTSSKTIEAVSEILRKLTPDPFLEFNLKYYEAGVGRFKEKWRHADINTVLYAISRGIRIESYLEIGVRCGRSMAIVAAANPMARIVGFDMWIPQYSGLENPGPEYVRGQLQKVDYQGDLSLITGDSRKTVPHYFREHPDEYFDLVTVDGDHSRRGAIIDLKNVIPRIKVGGVLVFDDLSNPWHPSLRGLWKKLVRKNGRFLGYSFEHVGYGVGFAIRKY